MGESQTNKAKTYYHNKYFQQLRSGKWRLKPAGKDAVKAFLAAVVLLAAFVIIMIWVGNWITYQICHNPNMTLTTAQCLQEIW